MSLDASTIKSKESILRADERLRINVNWFIKLRWAAVAGQLVTVLSVAFGLNVSMPLIPLFVIIGLTALTNLLLRLWYLILGRTEQWSAWGVRGNWIVDAIMTFDVLLLGGLLYFTGGAENPFSVFFLVNLALAAVVVQSEWIWFIGGLAILCYFLLNTWYVPLDVLHDRETFASFSGLLSVRYEGQIVAFSAATIAISYFIARLTRELRERDSELAAARLREERNEKLDALATLAAGAAHELATPLSTIAVVARELERHLESSGATNDCIEDARLIRTELAQCRTILDRMAGRAGESVGEGMTEMTVAGLVEEMLAGLPHTDRVSISHGNEPNLSLNLPRVAIGQALRGIVKNAIDAAGRNGQIQIKTCTIGPNIGIEIRDNGPGMPEEILKRAGEPFFTTKQPGEGTGLGLFLARAVIDRLGGVFEIHSEAGVGTTAEIILPRAPTRLAADHALPSA
ncbi:ATP-binding protein [bacterium]|nr:ATP-binding protein [bacterium]